MGSHSTTGSLNDESMFDDVRPLGGAIAGVLVFVAGFVATNALFLYRYSQLEGPEGDVLRELFAESPPEVLGWLFYNAHSVEILVTSEYVQETDTINLLELTNVGSTTTYYAIPAILLCIAGYVLARGVQESASKQSAVVAGASVAIGYVPLLLAGTVVFEATDAGTTIGPQLDGSLLLVGLVYALACGGLGGYLNG